MDDFELAAFEVDVFPAEAEKLPTAQAEAEGQDVQGVESMIL
ncbi:hypothetical protein [Nonomuraea maritima]